jgi:hypothetical protein
MKICLQRWYLWRTFRVMKFSKTWGIVIAALLTGTSLVVSTKLGIVVAIALLIVARLLRGPSASEGIIGVEHIDRPRTGSYGGGFIPGGLLSRGGLGTQFGVYGASVADNSPDAYLKGHRKEYAEERRSVLAKVRRKWLATAIRKAEARTGHQILVVVGPLEEDHVAKADRVAAQWPAASIVVCIDPVRGTYEVRWHDPSFAVDAAHLATVGYLMHQYKFAKAIALLAEVLPVRTAGDELPDIIEG